MYCISFFIVVVVVVVVVVGVGVVVGRVGVLFVRPRQTTWNKRPLFRRKEDMTKGGHDGYFRTGAEAADML